MADEKLEKDFCNKHSIKQVATCPCCGKYMSVDEEGYFCDECDMKDLWETI